MRYLNSGNEWSPTVRLMNFISTYDFQKRIYLSIEFQRILFSIKVCEWTISEYYWTFFSAHIHLDPEDVLPTYSETDFTYVIFPIIIRSILFVVTYTYNSRKEELLTS